MAASTAPHRSKRALTSQLSKCRSSSSSSSSGGILTCSCFFIHLFDLQNDRLHPVSLLRWPALHGMSPQPSSTSSHPLLPCYCDAAAATKHRTAITAGRHGRRVAFCIAAALKGTTKKCARRWIRMAPSLVQKR